MIAISRYEILDAIATGQWATVYRARDCELGREVVVKQIHAQFLADERQLARYWQEAQLLASFQHPNVLTIHDIVRPRGWLVLERMQGNLTGAMQSEGIDLDYLRVALIDSLEALRFLHANGIIHGDIKPSNLLTDSQGRVKLGDFGLARRICEERESLLKGTTKYIAPELVSEEFGAVGPASDLYSLGMVAYELLCGSQFETLFPGINVFGQDAQTAWLMWHAAPDRRLPDIQRVLEGVPEDLANAISRLVIKDQSRRYGSADEVLEYLRLMAMPTVIPVKEDPKAEAARLAEVRRKRRRRYTAMTAAIFSAVLCAAMMIPEETPAPPLLPPSPTQGTITGVYPDEWRFAMAGPDSAQAIEMPLARYDRIFINDRSCLLRDLQLHDRVFINTYYEDTWRRIQQIFVSRPVLHQGRIKSVQNDSNQVTFVIDQGDASGRELTVHAPPELSVTLNGRTHFSGHVVKLGDLKQDDHVTVRHLDADQGCVATSLDASRIVKAAGILREVELKQNQLIVAIGNNKREELTALPWSSDCEYTLNGRRIFHEKRLGPGDLRPGDQISITHDTHLRKVEAYRVLNVSGVIHSLQQVTRTIEIVPEGGKAMNFVVPVKCKIDMDGETITWDTLHQGDRVEVAYDALEAKAPEALHLSAHRPEDSKRWALVIGMQQYDDHWIKSPAVSVADAVLLHETLVKRYSVPVKQSLLLTDDNFLRIQQGAESFLQRVGKNEKIIAYFIGTVYQDADLGIVMAAKDTNLKHLSKTSLPLQWLVDALEKCFAKEKLLLLDACPDAQVTEKTTALSTVEMIGMLKAPPQRPPFRTVVAVASCQAGQRRVIDAKNQHGLFAWSLAEGFSGKADQNHDNLIETTELFDYLRGSMAAAADRLRAKQAPELFLPDDRPPRLTEEAKKAIRELAVHARQSRINLDEAGGSFRTARKLAGTEPEPNILMGMILLRAKDRDAALKHFDQLKTDHPELLISWQAKAWLYFEKRSYSLGVQELAQLASKIAKLQKPTAAYPDLTMEMFQWIGQLREFAATAVPEALRPAPALLESLDKTLTSHGRSAQECYERGRTQTRTVLNRFAQDTETAENDAVVVKIKVERRQLVHYASFPVDFVADQCLKGLDR